MLTIQTLGGFSLSWGDITVSDAGSRSKKVWSLLACLVCSRGQYIPQQKLISLLWGEGSANPENALRITLHRLRALLEPLWPGAGMELILSRDGACCFTDAVPAVLDFERFEALCQTPEGNPDRLSHILEALSLYQGEFLPRQASEMWVIPVSTHFQNQYLLLSLEAASRLASLNRHGEAVQLLRRACVLEPYHEPLHQALMEALAAAGDRKEAAAVYERLNKRLFSDFGIRPNEQTQKVYRACAYSPDLQSLPMEKILSELREPAGNQGALVCDYDYFKVLCHATSRSMERSGITAHVGLLSIGDSTGKTMSRKTLDRTMTQFGEVLQRNLRRGDMVSRCSLSQYILLLPGANYENSCMVCRRVITAFFQTHPGSAARIQYMVQPLTPSISIP